MSIRKESQIAKINKIDFIVLKIISMVTLLNVTLIGLDYGNNNFKIYRGCKIEITKKT